MEQLAKLLADVANLATQMGSPEDGVSLALQEIRVDLPIEARLRGGQLWASAPRGRLKTDFDVPHGRIRAHFEVMK